MSTETQDAAGVRPRRGLAALVGGTAVDLDRLPMLHVVVDRLAKLMTASFRGVAGDAEVRIGRARPVVAKEFFAAAAPPAMIAAIRIAPWDGLCLVALDPPLIDAALDIMLGGRHSRGESGAARERPYTSLERAVIERLARDLVAADIGYALEAVGAVRCTLAQLEVGATGGIEPAAVAIGFSAEVTLDGHRGRIEFLIPAATLEPVRDRLSQAFIDGQRRADAAWRRHLLAELPHATVTLRAVITRRRSSTAEVLRWRVGTSLALSCRHDDAIDVLCRDLLVLRARMAEKNGRVALHVEDRRLAEDWPRQA